MTTEIRYPSGETKQDIFSEARALVMEQMNQASASPLSGHRVLIEEAMDAAQKAGDRHEARKFSPL